MAIARVLRAHPCLKIQCHTTDPEVVVQDVLAERVDVGVAQVNEHVQEPRLVVERLSSVRIHVGCRSGHPLTREAKPNFAQLLDYPLASNVLRGASAAAASRRDGSLVAGDSGTPEFTPQVVVNTPAVARLIARGSDALVTGTASMLADDVAAGHIVLLDVDAPALRTTHGVMFLRERTLSPAARVFIDVLRQVEAEIRKADTPSASPRKSRQRPQEARMITNPQSGTNVHEIAAGIYRINTPVVLPGGAGAFNFNQYLIVDDEPLVFHTGPRRMFPLVSEAVANVRCRSSGCATSPSRTSRRTSAARSTTSSPPRPGPCRCAAAWPRWCPWTTWPTARRDRWPTARS